MFKNGVDITNITRNEFTNPLLAKHLLSREEYCEYNKIIKQSDKIHFLATRWAIKEAVIKAYNKLIPLPQINIIKKHNCYFLDSDTNVNISTSFEHPYIIASVILNLTN